MTVLDPRPGNRYMPTKPVVVARRPTAYDDSNDPRNTGIGGVLDSAIGEQYAAHYDRGYGAAHDWTINQAYGTPLPATDTPAMPNSLNSTTGSSARRRGGGGGGGGGGAAVATNQPQIDYLMQLLASKQWQAQQPDYSAQFGALDQLTGTVNAATAQDQAAATASYNGLDQYLGAHQSNPYANVQMQQTQRAPDMNAYLQSQGAGGMPVQSSNIEDTGSGAFQNVLALLGAANTSAQQSRGAESQMARTFAGQQIGAQDNAYLAGIGQQRATLTGQQSAAKLAQQQALDAERRQIMLQLAPLLSGKGAGAAPDLSQYGF